MKDFTFSDGVRIPAGTFVCIPLYATHYDDHKYAESSKFDPNRFAADAPGAGATALAEKDVELRQQQMVTPSPHYLSWGLGRHSWYVILGQAVSCQTTFYLVSQKKSAFLFISPGRWFAATELKTMLAHLVMTYDVKLKEEGCRPPNQWIGVTCVPNRSAQVLFRKRQV